MYINLKISLNSIITMIKSKIITYKRINIVLTPAIILHTYSNDCRRGCVFCYENERGTEVYRCGDRLTTNSTINASIFWA